MQGCCEIHVSFGCCGIAHLVLTVHHTSNQDITAKIIPFQGSDDIFIHTSEAIQ